MTFFANSIWKVTVIDHGLISIDFNKKFLH